MTKLVMDTSFQAKVAALDETIELCDESGRTLGYFCPVPGPEADKPQSPYTDEELRELEKDLTGRPLREILADLQRR